MRKRSVALNGHSTSVSLEDEFWSELRRMAGEQDLPLAALIAQVDERRSGANLSSALRLAVLADIKSGPTERAKE